MNSMHIFHGTQYDSDSPWKQLQHSRAQWFQCHHLVPCCCLETWLRNWQWCVLQRCGLSGWWDHGINIAGHRFNDIWDIDKVTVFVVWRSRNILFGAGEWFGSVSLYWCVCDGLLSSIVLVVLCVVMFVNDIRTCKQSCMLVIDSCNRLWLQRYVCVALKTVSVVQLAQKVYISLQLSTFQQLHYLQCSV